MHFLFWLIGQVSLVAHPIHVSVSDVVISGDHLEWTARIYKDDLLLGLYGKDANKVRQDDVDRIKKDILLYMQKHVQVTLGLSELQWTLTGLHPDPEAMWVTLSADLGGLDYHIMQLNTTLLMEVYADQKNIVNLEAPSSKSKTVIFESGDKAKTITF